MICGDLGWGSTGIIGMHQIMMGLVERDDVEAVLLCGNRCWMYL
jgi:hypothetical protein